MAWMGIGHTRIKHSPQVNWDQSTRSLLGCLKDPLISGLIQNISFEFNWNLFCACQILVAFPYIYTFALMLVLYSTEGNVQCASWVMQHTIQGVVRGRFHLAIKDRYGRKNSCSAELGSSRLRQHRCSTELKARFNHS